MAVRVAVDGREGAAQPGATLFALAGELGVRVPTSCQAMGKCRECLVEVVEGMELLSERADEERHLEPGFRLSCRARVAAQEGALRCHTLRRGALTIEEGWAGPARELALDPRVTRVGADVVRGGEVLASGPGAVLGLAIDVGTTTVVARLHDLEDGRLVATRSFENPQRFGGSDVLARIRYDGEHRGRLLQRVLLGYLGRAVEELPCEPARVFEAVVVGNTTMRDLFFGLDVQSIGEMPYRSTTEAALRAGEREGTALATSARKLRLPLHPAAEVLGLPLVGAHVGADAAACLLATGMGERGGLEVLMDLGTNTELLVARGGDLFAASCPAGPAFEGGAIRCGMPALEGAIEAVALDAEGRAACEVIGGGAPAGLCGSGLVALLGELLRTGRMNSRGRFEEGPEDFVVDAGAGVALSEADVNELAQAKGANAAGLQVVLDHVGARVADVERLYLAGGFARRLDLDAARRIGLLPDLPDGRIVKVGNAALEGASIALLSERRRRELERRVLAVEQVSLELHPGFFDFFVDGCQFAPQGGGG